MSLTARTARLLETAKPQAFPIGQREERLADDALLAMHKLRDTLVLSNRNIPACKVDEAMEALTAACRMVFQ